MIKKSFEFFNLFSSIGKDFEDRKSKIVRCFKTCLRCEVIKPIYQFSTDKRNINGRISICKKCRAIEYLKYYYQNRDRVLIVNKKYRDDHRGQRTKYFQDYQKDHKKHLQKIGKAWYKKNRVRIRKRNLKRQADLKMKEIKSDD